ncbi:MAG TPA: isoprenylcysteine carboxylmethyltransferase family protein [Gemmatimonadaceae bacterium]|nr:isoprenylcysteine carboxylmethyltransferase family protein [Gemmatimonadaceae bacterium]
MTPDDDRGAERGPQGGLLGRALAAVLLMPGTVAFLVPWLLRPDGAAVRSSGLLVLGLGTAMLLWCVRDFYVAGRGSLAPWSPPERLVVVGLYRYSRNPMYVAVLSIVAGWALAFDAAALWVYAGTLGLAFHLRVVHGEEPWLARTHGDRWVAYQAAVPRWLPLRFRQAPLP